MMRRGGGGGIPAPSLVSLDVSSGTEVGGTSVVLTGVNLFGATSVSVNGVSATLGANTATTQAFTTPAYTSALSSTAADNAVDVVITTPGGIATLTDAFTYTSEIARILGSKYSKEHRANDPRIALNVSAVSSWPDYAGNGAAAQGTAANQPAFSATSFNGGPGITFDGSNDYLDATLTSAVAAGARAYVLTTFARIADGAGGENVTLQEASANNCSLHALYFAGGFVRNYRRQHDGSSDILTSNVALDTNRHCIESANAANGDPTMRIDGVNKITSTTHDYLSTHPYNHLVVGGYIAGGVPGGFGNATIAHIVVANAMPTAQQLADIRAFVTGAHWVGYTSSSLGLP